MSRGWLWKGQLVSVADTRLNARVAFAVVAVGDVAVVTSVVEGGRVRGHSCTSR
jgi:hypothetical protein